MGLLLDCRCQLPSSIAEFNAQCLARTWRYLGIPFTYSVLSRTDFDLSTVSEQSEWARQLQPLGPVVSEFSHQGRCFCLDERNLPSRQVPLEAAHRAGIDRPSILGAPRRSHVERSGRRNPLPWFSGVVLQIKVCLRPQLSHRFGWAE